MGNKTLKLIAGSLLTTIILGTAGFFWSMVIDVTQVKAEVEVQKNTLKTMEIKLDKIIDFLIKR